MVKANLNRQNHTKKHTHTHTHSQKEKRKKKKEENIRQTDIEGSATK